MDEATGRPLRMWKMRLIPPELQLPVGWQPGEPPLSSSSSTYAFAPPDPPIGPVWTQGIAVTSDGELYAARPDENCVSVHAAGTGALLRHFRVVFASTFGVSLAIVDDLGFSDVSWHLKKPNSTELTGPARTPFVDSLVEKGTELYRHYG